MTGMDGINSLQKLLGALKANDTASVNGTAATGATKTSLAIAKLGPGRSADSASLSASGALVAQGDMSDVRTTKVAELKAAIAAGTYYVSASAVADKMVQSLLT